MRLSEAKPEGSRFRFASRPKRVRLSEAKPEGSRFRFACRPKRVRPSEAKPEGSRFRFACRPNVTRKAAHNFTLHPPHSTLHHTLVIFVTLLTFLSRLITVFRCSVLLTPMVRDIVARPSGSWRALMA